MAQLNTTRANSQTPKKLSDRVRDQKIRELIRRYQKDYWSRPIRLSDWLALQLIPLMEPELRAVANYQLRGPNGYETFEQAWALVVNNLDSVLESYNLKTMPRERLPLQLSFLLLKLLRCEREELCR